MKKEKRAILRLLAHGTGPSRETPGVSALRSAAFRVVPTSGTRVSEGLCGSQLHLIDLRSAPAD